MAGVFQPNVFQPNVFQEGPISRTASDSLSSVTDSVSRVGTFSRTVSDSISSITEAVVATKNTTVRTLTDSISSISETPTRVLTLIRTASATLSSITESVVRGFTLSRTTADSLSSITEAVVRIQTFARTVSDSISSITEAVVRVGGALVRAISDIIAFIYDAVTATTPYQPDAPIVVDMAIGGSSFWGDVQFEKARFDSQVNGVAGTCEFRVRDEDRTKLFTVGQEIVLTINDQVLWRGFIATVNRIYVFPALNVDDFGPARFIDIKGTDINILLTKRIVFDQTTPTNIMAPLLPEHTPDVTAITELFADWLDLSGDGLDTFTLVEPVGDTTWTQEGRAWEGSDTWAQAMQSIGSLPAAIYYINPDKKFVYTDVDTPNAPFALSDQPDGVTSFGYREMEVLMDGSSLANDVMCWGIGYGSQTPVFVRDIDSASVTEHGVWQLGQTTFGVYKQSTISRIAGSIIDGSPQSKRGTKDDRPAAMVVTYQPGLRVADKVDFTSNVFGYNDVIPIRKMEVTFDGPNTPKYALTLSHEIDTPFSFFDPFPLLKPPKIKFCPPGFVMGPAGTCVPVILPGPIECSAEVCGITDDFQRVEAASSWGIATCLIPWRTDPFAAGGTISVDGQAGIILLTDPAQPRRLYLGGSGSVSYQAPVDLSTKTMRFQLPDYVSTLNNVYTIRWSPTDHPGLTIGPNVGIGFIDSGVTTNSYISYGASADLAIPKTFWDSTSTYTWTVSKTVSGMTQSITNGTNTYTVTHGSAPTLAQCELFFDIVGALSADITLRITEIIIPEITRCTVVQFDNFYRLAGPDDWQFATPAGNLWTTVDSGAVSVDYGVALMSVDATNSAEVTQLSPPIYLISGGTRTMHTRFRVSPIAEAPDNPNEIAFELWNGGARLVIVPSTEVGEGSLLIADNTSGPIAFVDYIDWESDVRYDVRWEQTWQGIGRAKIWRTGDPEPDWMLEGDTVTAFTNDYFNVKYTSGGDVDSTLRLDFIDFDYSDRPCYFGGPDPLIGSAANAWVCEEFTSTGTDTITLQHSFLASSPWVFVNGLLQIQTSFTPDPAAGTIVLDFTPPVGTSIRVCYWALP